MFLKKYIVVQVVTIVWSIVLICSFAYGFTRKLCADYPDKDANNISSFVVLQQKNQEKEVRFEKSFSEACADGTCMMELELEPQAEYLFKVFFKNGVGDGKVASLNYQTGKVVPVENIPPVMQVDYEILSDTKILITGVVADASHVDVRISGNKTIQNFGYSDFSFEVDMDRSATFFLEATDIHGNLAVMNLNMDRDNNYESNYAPQNIDFQNETDHDTFYGVDTYSYDNDSYANTEDNCNIVPHPVTLIFPFGTIINDLPTFTWNDVDATWYKIFLRNNSTNYKFAQWYEIEDNDLNYPEVNCQEDECSIMLDFVLESGNYEWWIKSWNDYESNWSEGTEFTVSD